MSVSEYRPIYSINIETDNVLGEAKKISNKSPFYPKKDTKIPHFLSFYCTPKSLDHQQTSNILCNLKINTGNKSYRFCFNIHTHTHALLFYFRQINGDKIFVCFALLSHTNLFQSVYE